MIPSRSDFIEVRGKRTHVLHWGRDGAPKVFMVHGWMDVGASFQFVVDYLKGDWHVIAPDWRGFGLTERNGTDTYWFPDYVADLDAILRHYQPEGRSICWATAWAAMLLVCTRVCARNASAAWSTWKASA